MSDLIDMDKLIIALKTLEILLEEAEDKGLILTHEVGDVIPVRYISECTEALRSMVDGEVIEEPRIH